MRKFVTGFLVICFVIHFLPIGFMQGFADSQSDLGVELTVEDGLVYTLDEDITITATVSTDTAVPDSVMLYANNQLLEEKDIMSIGNYSFVWTPSKTGEYALYAQGYDSLQNMVASNIIRVNVTDTGIVESISGTWTADTVPNGEFGMVDGQFQNTSGTKLRGLPTGWEMQNTNSKAKLSKVDLGEGHRTALSINLNEAETSQTFLQNASLSLFKGNNIMEFDFMMDNLNQDMLIALRDSSNTRDDLIQLDSGAIKFRYSGTGGSYVKDEWYHAKLEYNFESETIAFTVSDSEGTMVCNVENAFLTSPLEDIKTVRIHYNTDSGFSDSGHLYLDNLKLYTKYSIAKIIGVYDDGDNELTEAVDTGTTKLIVKSTKTLDESTISSSSVKLYKGYGNEEMGATISLSTDKKNIILEPTNPLSASSYYRIEISEDVSTNNRIICILRVILIYLFYLFME